MVLQQPENILASGGNREIVGKLTPPSVVVTVAEEVSVVTPVSVVTVVVADASELSPVAEASMLEAMLVAREETDSATEEIEAATEVAAPAQY